ncbi:hypothetical protein LPJ53_001602 [Coemansia erecta]|uniref:HAD-like protein n=1 Tax=Coemansia erecta TaxID=147472 RepID=A0A9W7XZP3_9FUNG|nr:hypothetical protein LPJ53_001602 [Coemansia erecta]
MPAIKATAIMFDMDGTLVNTIASVENYWRGMAAKYNIDAETLLHNVHGHPTYDVLCKWFPASLHSHEAADKAEADLMHDKNGVFAVPGAPELLTQLDTRRWTIVTGATRALALTRMEQVNLPIPQTLVAARDVKNGKPHPECYRLGAERLGVAPEETVVFEDSINGTKAGFASGATVIGVLTSTLEKDLLNAGAKYAIADFSSLQVFDRGDHLEIVF